MSDGPGSSGWFRDGLQASPDAAPRSPAPLEGVTDYRYDAPGASYPQPGADLRGAGADPEPWRSPPEGGLRDQDEKLGPWPTRVSGPLAIAAVVLVIVVAVVGAIGLPRLLGGGPDEEVFEGTSLTLPAEIAGLPRLPDAKITAEDRRSAEQLMAAVSPLLTRQTAVYARANGRRLTVVTGRPITALADQQLEILRTGFTSGMAAAQAPVTPLDAGPLGGWFGCGQTQHGTTLCLSMDAGGLVSIVINAKDQSAITVAQSARQAVEHRTPTPP